MNITVYLGANAGNDPALLDAVRELGTWIGASGNALVYGGSKSGLMGAIADSVLDAGGEVTGVEPEFFIQDEFQHEGITKLIMTKDMMQRKSKMIELGDAFIAFPGGTGTLEEITEVMSKVSLKHLKAPCILYNLNGYYDDLKRLLERMIKMGLSTKERQEGIYFAEDLEDVKRILSGTFQLANERDVPCVYALICSRIAWMDEQGIESWNKTGYLDRFPEAYFLEKCHAGELYVLRGPDGSLRGAVVLQTRDSRWEGLPPMDAYYLHNLVSALDAHSAGRVILHEVERLARENGKDALRLDCIHNNEAINRFYESAGYVACGECTDGPYHGILREKQLSATL